MLLPLLTLLLRLLTAEACLQCDRRVRRMHENFVLSAKSMAGQINLKMISDQAFETYKETSSRRKGVIDPTTMYRARTEYQSEFSRFLKTGQTGEMEAILIMEKGRSILEKHLDVFIRDGLCPNMCGLLKRRVMNCISCRFKTYICASPTGQQDCGEIPVQAEEGEQAVLDCFHPWHQLLLGKAEYHYSWAPGEPGARKPSEGDFRALVVTDESSIVLNQLQTGEAGTYRCSLRGPDGAVFYRVDFLLTVTPQPYQTPRPPLTLPTLPAAFVDDESFSPDPGLLVPVIATVTAVSLAVCVGLAVMLGALMNKWTCPTEEEEPMETSTQSSESQASAV